MDWYFDACFVFRTECNRLEYEMTFFYTHLFSSFSIQWSAVPSSYLQQAPKITYVYSGSPSNQDIEVEKYRSEFSKNHVPSECAHFDLYKSESNTVNIISTFDQNRTEDWVLRYSRDIPQNFASCFFTGFTWYTSYVWSKVQKKYSYPAVRLKANTFIVSFPVGTWYDHTSFMAD